MSLREGEFRCSGRERRNAKQVPVFGNRAARGRRRRRATRSRSALRLRRTEEILEFAALWEKAHGAALTRSRLGSLAELDVEMERRQRAHPADLGALLPTMYAKAMFGGHALLGPSSNALYPNIHPATVADAIARARARGRFRVEGPSPRRVLGTTVAKATAIAVFTHVVELSLALIGFVALSSFARARASRSSRPIDRPSRSVDRSSRFRGPFVPRI